MNNTSFKDGHACYEIFDDTGRIVARCWSEDDARRICAALDLYNIDPEWLEDATA